MIIKQNIALQQIKQNVIVSENIKKLHDFILNRFLRNSGNSIPSLDGI